MLNSLSKEEKEQTTKVHVGNLPEGATQDSIRALFERYGPVGSVSVSRHEFSREWRAVVEMPDKAKAQAAISALNGKDFKGHNLNVTEHVPL